MASTSVGPQAIQETEVGVASALNEAVCELEHAEGLDAEQRAEVYTILQAMLADCRRHESILRQFMIQVNKGAIHV